MYHTLLILLVPTDFYLFRSLQNALNGKNFRNNTKDEFFCQYIFIKTSEFFEEESLIASVCVFLNNNKLKLVQNRSTNSYANHCKNVQTDISNVNCLFDLQIDQKPFQKVNHHENHVSQITKTIQAQANHSNHIQLHNHSNHVTSEHENHVSIGRVPNHVSAVNHQTHQKNLQNQRLSPSQEWRQPDDNVRVQEDSIYESGPVVNDGKHSLLQYAMLNFRQSTEK